MWIQFHKCSHNRPLYFSNTTRSYYNYESPSKSVDSIYGPTYNFCKFSESIQRGNSKKLVSIKNAFMGSFINSRPYCIEKKANGPIWGFLTLGCIQLLLLITFLLSCSYSWSSSMLFAPMTINYQFKIRFRFVTTLNISKCRYSKMDSDGFLLNRTSNDK